MPDVIIIGGGVIGLSLACDLAGEGVSVSVFDQAEGANSFADQPRNRFEQRRLHLMAGASQKRTSVTESERIDNMVERTTAEVSKSGSLSSRADKMRFCGDVGRAK